MKKLLLLINPNAGKGGFRNGLGDVLYTFHRAGYRVTVTFTNEHGDPARIASRLAPDFDRLVCVGGDGTLGETVAGFMQLPPERRPELGYIPMGTTNDCAITLGLSHDPVQAAYTAANGQTIPLDVGLFNQRDYFTYVAAFGAFTEVSYETPQDQKNTFGRLAYILDALRRLPNLTHRWTEIQYDGGVLEDDFIFGAVANSRSIAGVLRLDELGVSLSDGLFEIILIRTPESLLQLGTIVTDILANHFESEYVTVLQTRQVSFKFREPVAWTLDGEDGGSHRTVTCDNISRVVRMVVNEYD